MRALAAFLLLTFAGQPAPRLETKTYESKAFGTSRRVQVYLPPDGRRPIAGLLICLWGQDYVGAIDAPATLDALIRAGRIPPIAALFLEGDADRFQSIETTRRMTESIAGEVLPWARTTLGIAVDTRHTIVAGYSAAGLASTYAAFAHPEVIGNVLAQSGAFWRGFEGDAASEPEWLATQFGSAARRDTRFYLEVGGAETREAGGSGVSLLQANQHLRDALKRKGYDLTYVEVPGAQHEFGHWKAAFGPGLVALTKDWK
jgi:enterochelin esterase-like enzyme